MSLRTVIAVVGLIAVGLVGGGCQAAPEIVWPEGATSGAQIVACPTTDCSGLIAAAEQKLTRAVRDRVVRARVGRMACSPDGRVVCVLSPPIGLGHAAVVVLDLDGSQPVLVNVLCWRDRPSAIGASVVAWNGLWCEGT